MIAVRKLRILRKMVVPSGDGHDRPKRRDRHVYIAGQLPDYWLEAVEQSNVDPRHEHLNAEIAGWKP